MDKVGYLIFHLNLAFSSIEKESRSEVIEKCYHPLLDIIDENNYPMGIELTGWTIEQIEKNDPRWIKRFKKMLKNCKCELIGSGYSQIIGPLVPVSVNEWNQKLGLDVYRRVLNERPKIALVNEMAFSNSLVDLYQKYDYTSLIMDRDNIKLALSDTSKVKNFPSHALGNEGASLPILWGDSILFQKLQHFAHGDISRKDYISYLRNLEEKGETIFPIYCNDAEVFDYRPGRFSAEKPLQNDGEWNRVNKILKNIEKEGISITLPSEVLKIQEERVKYNPQKLTNCSYPVPVKKQVKYNISRWAVTGRNDLKLNSFCHSLEKELSENHIEDADKWKNLCELWSSDYRTHITENRWNDSIDKTYLELKNFQKEKSEDHNEFITLEKMVEKSDEFSIKKDEENILLEIETKKIDLSLNIKKGLAINKLKFKSHNEAILGTLAHGYFSDISLGADFFSGNTIIEFPTLRKRLTDLEKVEPKFKLNEDNIEISAEIESTLGKIIKTYIISKFDESIEIDYEIKNLSQSSASIRLGILTFLNQDDLKSNEILCANGGRSLEKFNIRGNFNQASPASSLVSSSRGFGATTGEVIFKQDNRNLKLNWNPSECAAIVMLQNSISGENILSRMFFSLREIDDTLKCNSESERFKFRIST